LPNRQANDGCCRVCLATQNEDSCWCYSAEVIVPTTIDELTQQAMQLSFEERAELADRLFRRLEPPGDDVSTEEWAAAWLPELERRVQAHERGAGAG
jgi:putative addiction module component (TIGR02574 family)